MQYTNSYQKMNSTNISEVMEAVQTKKLSYRKDDRAMHPIWMPRKFLRVPGYAHGYFS